MIAIDEFSALGADHVIALLARGRESGHQRAARHPGAGRSRPRRARVPRPGARHHRGQDRPPPGRPGFGPDRRADGRHRRGLGGDLPDRRAACSAATTRAAARVARSSGSSCTRTRSRRSRTGEAIVITKLKSRRRSGSGSSRRASNRPSAYDRNRRVGPSRDGSNRRGRRGSPETKRWRSVRGRGRAPGYRIGLATSRAATANGLLGR